MNIFKKTDAFNLWLSTLTDPLVKAKVLIRIDRAILGNFGDCEPIGEGVSEMKIHSGPGYRLYFTRIGTIVYLLLTGGDKSTQNKDIEDAKQLARNLKKAH
jgi:putative addiction module killer protein